jgi:nitrogen fixation protein NifZ
METITFKINQKVKVKKIIKDDGSCSGCGSKRGDVVAEVGMEGFVCDITDFLFKPVIVVHFIEKQKRIGFREEELDIIEDFDEEEGKWIMLQ